VTYTDEVIKRRKGNSFSPAECPPNQLSYAFDSLHLKTGDSNPFSISLVLFENFHNVTEKPQNLKRETRDFSGEQPHSYSIDVIDLSLSDCSKLCYRQISLHNKVHLETSIMYQCHRYLEYNKTVNNFCASGMCSFTF